jgi:beta-lactam-binding protein with PASTA domain/tRNA A-37 threonylcarbamoyl transferase component Bud32
VVVSRSTDQIGRVLSGRYRLIAPVGTGASAQVFLADDVRLKRRVAVKVLHEALADDESFLRRFRAEAQAAAALNHPNILAVYDWGEDDGSPYLVTEYLAGGSLRSMLDRGVRLTPSQALLVGLETARALDYAHRRGFVHRDIKPANLLYGEDGRLRVADFGLARALAEAAWTEPQGAVLGTARYASPEQAQGETVDGRADVYALGLVLIESVTGAVPFAADTTIGTLMARVGRDVEVPAALDQLRPVLERAGRADPAQRPEAGAIGASLMALASKLPRPEPLPLVGTAAPLVAPTGDDGGDRTLLTAADGEEAGLAPTTTVFLDDGLDYVHDDDEGGRRRRRRWPWVVLAIVLAAAVGGAAFWLYDEATVPSYAVPNVEGMDVERALAAIEAVDGQRWRVEREETRRDGTTPGQVLGTDPAFGEELDEDGTLRLTVSLGNTEADVPQDLVGKPQADAEAALAAAGQFAAVVTSEPSEDVAAGIVLRLGEVPARLPKGSEVPLVVSSGPAPRVVPGNLNGGTYDPAAAAIEAVQLVPKKVEEFHDTIPAGKIVGTRPAAGTEVPRGSTVEVVISKGPDVVKIPSVQGMTLDQATATLAQNGLTVGDVFGPANGRPFSTNPEAGTSVKRGTTVDIYLRR